MTSCLPASITDVSNLSGKIWLLVELSGKTVVAGSGITAQFSADGKVSGSAGCNRYLGTYKVVGTRISISSLASTMMMCDDVVMAREYEYLKKFEETRIYMVKGDELYLAGEGKNVLMLFQTQNQTLAGTSWNVIAYNNGNRAVTSVLIGTTLTVEFRRDGKVEGSAGCNNYCASYTVNGQLLTIGPLATTKNYCVEPLGAMDQETQLLAALQSASTYQIESNRLQLRTIDGVLAVDLGSNN